MSAAYVLLQLLAPPPAPLGTGVPYPTAPAPTPAPASSSTPPAPGALAVLALFWLIAGVAGIVHRRRDPARVHGAVLLSRALAEDAAAAAAAAPAEDDPHHPVCQHLGRQLHPAEPPPHCTLLRIDHPTDRHESWSAAGDFIDSWPTAPTEALR